MVVSKSGDGAALVISGLCEAFQSQPIEEEDEQERDNDFDNYVDDDYNFDISDDSLYVFPSINQFYQWPLTIDERTRAESHFRI